MECKFAIWSNGKVVFLGVRTGFNELVLSPPHPWSHPETLKAIVGLTYAAIDDSFEKWSERGVNLMNELIGQTDDLVQPAVQPAAQPVAQPPPGGRLLGQIQEER